MTLLHKRKAYRKGINFLHVCGYTTLEAKIVHKYQDYWEKKRSPPYLSFEHKVKDQNCTLCTLKGGGPLP